jgi:hypothetical protein
MWYEVYLMIGSVLAIPLARIYWIKWRETPSKTNIILPLKIQNRLVDSFVFLNAYIILIVLYPFYLIELLMKNMEAKKK